MKIPLSHGSIVHDTDVFVTAAKFRMIFLVSKTLRTSKFAAITHTTLWTVVESRPFSGWGNFFTGGNSAWQIHRFFIFQHFARGSVN